MKGMLWNVYQEFIKNGTIVEDILFEKFSKGNYLIEEGLGKEEVEEYRSKYKTKEELFKDIEIVEVRIHLYDYDVIVSVPWEEWDIAIAVREIFDEKERYGYLYPEEESPPAEMKYD